MAAGKFVGLPYQQWRQLSNHFGGENRARVCVPAKLITVTERGRERLPQPLWAAVGVGLVGCRKGGAAAGARARENEVAGRPTGCYVNKVHAAHARGFTCCLCESCATDRRANNWISRDCTAPIGREEGESHSYCITHCSSVDTHRRHTAHNRYPADTAIATHRKVGNLLTNW